MNGDVRKHYRAVRRFQSSRVDRKDRGISGSIRVSNWGFQSTQRVVLPNDLSASLRYLDGSDLQRLLAAVNMEIDRRKRGASAADADQAARPTSSRSVPPHDEHTNIAEIPEGKANLIRASFGAGMKPATIARTFGVSLSLVNRVIRSTLKSQR